MAVDSVAAVDSAAAAAAVDHPQLMEHRRVEAADRRLHTERLPAVAVVSEVEHRPRATGRLPRPTVRLPRVTGHRVAVAAGVDIPEGEDLRVATEHLVPAAVAALEVVASEEADCLRLTVHPREAVVVDTPAVAVADTPAVVAADFLAVAVSEAGKMS